MSQAKRLAGKRALVTGGSRGIGAAIVRRLAVDGAAVAVNYAGVLPILGFRVRPHPPSSRLGRSATARMASRPTRPVAHTTTLYG